MVLPLKIVEESILRLFIATEEKCDTDKEGLFQDLVVINILNVLAEELYAPDSNEGILLCINNLFITSPIFSIPVSSWRRELLILNLNNLSE